MLAFFLFFPYNNVMETTDNVFRQLRLEHHYSQMQLANLLQLDQTSVSKWELDIALPGPVTLIKLSELYDVSIDYLLGRSDQRHPDGLKEPTLNEQELRKLNSLSPLVVRPCYRVVGAEANLISSYRRLSPSSRKMVRDIISLLAEQDSKKTEEQRKKELKQKTGQDGQQ